MAGKRCWKTGGSGACFEGGGVGLNDPQRSPPTLGCKVSRGTGAWLATLPPAGHLGLSHRSRRAGWLQDGAEPTWGSCLALQEGAPGSCVSADTWNADSAQLVCHSCYSSALAETLLCPRAAPCRVLHISVTRPGRLQEGANSPQSVLPTDNGEATVLQAGRHEFPFTFQLPE